MAKKDENLGSKKKTSSREASFGVFPESQSAAKGAMIDNFGHQIRSGIWPPAAASVDQKSGFPEKRKM